jgi:hypothetical protein
MGKSVFRIIPLTIIPLTFFRPFPSVIRRLRLGCGGLRRVFRHFSFDNFGLHANLSV